MRTIPKSHFEEEDSGLDRSSNYDKTGGIDHVLSLKPESGQYGLGDFLRSFYRPDNQKRLWRSVGALRLPPAQSLASVDVSSTEEAKRGASLTEGTSVLVETEPNVGRSRRRGRRSVCAHGQR
jgi:hypothetical protein